MRTISLMLVALGLIAGQAVPQELPAGFPAWAYGEKPLLTWPRPVPPGLPAVVQACAGCHGADGAGGPASARIAGLPAEYQLQQLKDMASGARTNTVPLRGSAAHQQSAVTSFTEAKWAQAADYFSQIPPRAEVVVVESAMVPRPTPAGLPDEATQEVLGSRIVELPQGTQTSGAPDATGAQYVAYAPPGSVERGKALTRAPAGKSALTCARCHGVDFRGVDLTPSIAGRSPSYVVRQLWDLRSGTRHGGEAEDMQPVVAVLSPQDMLALAAFLATRKP